MGADKDPSSTITLKEGLQFFLERKINMVRQKLHDMPESNVKQVIQLLNGLDQRQWDNIPGDMMPLVTEGINLAQNIEQALSKKNILAVWKLMHQGSDLWAKHKPMMTSYVLDYIEP